MKYNDLTNQIKEVLLPISTEVDRVALFGSFLDSPKEANDIDILVWLKSDNIGSSIKMLTDSVSEKQYKIEKYICKYSKLPEVEELDVDRQEFEKPIHFSWLPSQYDGYKDSDLWVLNKDRIEFLYNSESNY